QYVDAHATHDTLTVAAKLAELPPVASAGALAYRLTVNGEPVTVHVVPGAGPSLVDARTGMPLQGAVEWNAASGFLTMTLDRECPCHVSFESLVGRAVADRAPDAGTALVAPHRQGSEADPEATDPANDAAGGNLGHMDVTKVWVSGETATSFTVNLKVRDMTAAVSGPYEGGLRLGASVQYGVQFCLNNNVNRATDPNAPLFCYGVTAIDSTPAPSYYGSILSRDGTNSCLLNDLVTSGSINRAAGTVSWVLPKAKFDVTANSASGTSCVTESPVRGGNPITEGTVLTKLRGQAGHVVGVVVGTLSFTNLGDTMTADGSRPYTFGAAVTPLTVEAGGPYTGLVGQAVAIAATPAGGKAPYTCAWSASGVTFANANACATTVSRPDAGAVTLTVMVTDANGATATDTATFTATTTAAERVELLVDGLLKATVPVTTSTSSPTASFTGSVDVSSLAGQRTLEARWVDADGTLLDVATVTLMVQAAGSEPFVTLDKPGNDPTGANPLRGTIEVSGTAGHTGSGASQAGLNAHGFPLASGSVGGLRATTVEGGIVLPCANCQGGPGPLTADLGTSVTWQTYWFDPTVNGLDGVWLSVAGYAGANYTLVAEFGSPMDIWFFEDPIDAQDAAKGSKVGAAMPKTGKVPQGANWAFVYMRRPTQQGAADLQGTLDTAQLTLVPQIVPPSPPQLLQA
ncbi:MAG TPA: hypothetical protein VNZ52_16580, partial [Candidatus Thermoplasmatota archaeon]|nr:hypothetical protein [Candidatus Thermoplasmatota archaeon]